ncbi:MAG: hypothetical protein ACXW4U_11720, partial [Anaerolineales bacterium]
MKRLLFSIFTVLVLTGLILSACAPSATPTAAPVAPEPTEAPAEEQPAATEAPVAAEETVTIGFTSSLTGAQEV